MIKVLPKLEINVLSVEMNVSNLGVHVESGDKLGVNLLKLAGEHGESED